ncbi:MAG: type II toxin-antitoxin system RelE/ParE family toxin [Proteobacteria bacterium]|nr:type II toxin-antitoxin system RelE/ParE family toxin [Pseudomonadota bacterium]
MADRNALPAGLPVHFYCNENGKEPVRDWLKCLGRPDTLVIGEDIRVVQIGWPVGLPVCRPLGEGLYEVRSSLPNGRIARVLFCFHDNAIVLLHGFIKKTNKSPIGDVRLARERQDNVRRNKGG